MAPERVDLHAPEPDDADLDVAVDAVVAASGGDVRAAIRMLLVENALLEDDVARMSRLVSYGFTRGSDLMCRTPSRPG